MIEVDISHVWGQLSLPELLEVERDLSAAHEKVMGTDTGEAPLWLNPREITTPQERQEILAAAEKIRETSDVCVVVGAGGGCLGARAAVELLQGPHRNFSRGSKPDPHLFFVGNSFSTRQWYELMGLLEGRDFSVIVISKSGQTLESAIALRGLKWLLERRYGTQEGNARIYAVTDPVVGPLCQLAQEEGWKRFSIPGSLEGGFTLLSAAGLLPMAVAGVDLDQVLQGAEAERKAYDLRSFENPVWLYAGIRNALHRRGMALELLVSQEPAMHSFGLWWQQLFSRAEGKDGKGLFPVCAQFPGDIHGLGQMIQQGRHNLLETMVRFDGTGEEAAIGSDVKNLDGLNALAGKTMEEVSREAFQASVEAHADGGAAVITMDCGALTPLKLGELIIFFQLSCAVSAHTLGVEPFGKPGLEEYHARLAQQLGLGKNHIDFPN